MSRINVPNDIGYRGVLAEIGILGKFFPDQIRNGVLADFF